jgi:hypothetical protein
VLARRCAAGSPAPVTRAGTTARRPAAARSTPRPDAPSRVRRAVLVRELRSQLRSVQRGTATATFTATAPAETATATAKATAATATSTATAKAGAALKRRRPAPSHRQLIRRRATLGCLSGAVAVSVAVALIVSPLAGVPAGAALLALAGYVVHVRHEVLRAAAFRRTQQAVVLDRRRAVPVTDWLYGVPARTLPVESQPAPTSAVPAAPTPAVPAVPAVPDDGWLPVPVPLPTYLTAPPAPLRSTPWPDRAPVGSPDRQPIAAASSAAVVEPAEVERPLAVND